MAKQVFISHITAERELAMLLKEKIEKHFLGLVNVFVSSDQVSIEAGASWLETLRAALKTADLQVVLCSPASIGRPWVNFEAGAAWLQGVPVVPLCHSGLDPDHLPMPLATLQGGKVSDPDTFVRVYTKIAKLVPCEVPEIDVNALAAAASKFEDAAESTPGGSPVAALSSASAPSHPPSIEEMRRHAEAGNEQAVQLIASAQTLEAFSILMDLAVNNIDEKIKIAAIKALASFRTPGDLNPLCELLVQDRWQVAEACAKALGRFKNPIAIPYLIKASDQHVDWVTTQASATALGMFAPQQPETICPALIRALEIGSFEGEAASQSLRRYGALALPFLLDGLKNGSTVTGAILALKTIVLIGDPQALPTLETVRDDRRRHFQLSVSAVEKTAPDNVLAEMEKSILQLKNAKTSAGVA
jgi:hypothetical protein